MRIALCEAGALTPEHDAGARADSDLLSGFASLGHTSAVFEENESGMVENLKRFDPDLVLISRPGPFLRLYPEIAQLEKPIGYLAHDLHHRRLELQARILGQRSLSAQVMKTVESFCFTRSDLAILPTHSESIDARAIFPGANVTWMRYFNMQPESMLMPATTPDDFSVKSGLIFVGSSAHQPNLDGVSWFIHDVLPLVQSEVPDATLTVVGHWQEEQIRALTAPGVRFTGQVPGTELSTHMERAAAGISPLRFGAGMKRKTLDYLSRGLPVISSSYGVEGLSFFESEAQSRTDSAAGDATIPGVIISTSTSEWVTSVARLLQSPQLRVRLGIQGRAFVRNSFSQAQYLEDVQRVLAELERAEDE